MLKINRTIIASAAIALACMGGAAIATSAVAAAATNDNVHATGGDGTTVDTDGTQGDFTSSVQGTVDDDGDQDAFMVTAEEATPQYSAAK